MRLRKAVFSAVALALLLGGATTLFGQTFSGMTPEWALQEMSGNDVTGVSGYAATSLTGVLVDNPYVPVSANAINAMSREQVSDAVDAARNNSGLGINVTQGSSITFYPFDSNGEKLLAQLFPDKLPIGSSFVVKGELVGAGINVSSISAVN